MVEIQFHQILEERDEEKEAGQAMVSVEEGAGTLLMVDWFAHAGFGCQGQSGERGFWIDRPLFIGPTMGRVDVEEFKLS